MEITLIRVGNEEYAKTNKSFGLTTLRDRHAISARPRRCSSSAARAARSTRPASATAASPASSRPARTCPASGSSNTSTTTAAPRGRAADVNAYIRDALGEDFSAKDFRTWAGTLAAARALRDAFRNQRRGEEDTSHLREGGRRRARQHAGRLPQGLHPSRRVRRLARGGGSIRRLSEGRPRGGVGPPETAASRGLTREPRVSTSRRRIAHRAKTGAVGELPLAASTGRGRPVMRAAIRRAGALVVDEMPEPEPGPGQVLGKTLVCGICGSDLHALDHYDHMIDLSARLGAPSSMLKGADTCSATSSAARCWKAAREPRVGSRLASGWSPCPCCSPRKACRRWLFEPLPRRVRPADRCSPNPDAVRPNGLSPNTPRSPSPSRWASTRSPRPTSADDQVLLVVGCGPVGLAVIASLKARGHGPVIASDFSPDAPRRRRADGRRQGGRSRANDFPHASLGRIRRPGHARRAADRPMARPGSAPAAHLRMRRRAGRAAGPGRGRAGRLARSWSPASAWRWTGSNRSPSSPRKSSSASCSATRPRSSPPAFAIWRRDHPLRRGDHPRGRAGRNPRRLQGAADRQEPDQDHGAAGRLRHSESLESSNGFRGCWRAFLHPTSTERSWPQWIRGKLRDDLLRPPPAVSGHPRHPSWMTASALCRSWLHIPDR